MSRMDSFSVSAAFWVSGASSHALRGLAFLDPLLKILVRACEFLDLLLAEPGRAVGEDVVLDVAQRLTPGARALDFWVVDIAQIPVNVVAVAAGAPIDAVIVAQFFGDEVVDLLGDFGAHNLILIDLWDIGLF